MKPLDLHGYIGYTVDGVMQIKNGYGFRIKFRYADGKVSVQQKSGFKTQREAKDAREKTIGDIEKGEYVVYPRILVKDSLMEWFEQEIMSKTDSNNTYTTYGNIIYNYIIPEFGNRRVCDLSGTNIVNYIALVAETSESEAALCKTVFNTFLNYAKKKKIIAKNPMKGLIIKVYSKEGDQFHQRTIDEKKVLNEQQMGVLIDNAKDTPIYIMVLFAVLMGLRISEIIGLKYSDVDFNEQTLTIKRQLGRIAGMNKEDCPPKMLTKQERKTKTDSGVRTIIIPDLVFEEILRLKKQYEKNRNRRKREFRDWDYIVCSTYGMPRSRQYHTNYYKELLKASSLPIIRWHDLRHTNCTFLIKHDGNPKAVSKNMGHKHEKITLGTYTDKDEIVLDETDALESFISEVIPEAPGENDNSDFAIDVSEYI